MYVYSVVCDKRSHVWLYEAGGLASHSGATAIPVLPSNGMPFILSNQLSLIFSI